METSVNASPIPFTLLLRSVQDSCERLLAWRFIRVIMESLSTAYCFSADATTGFTPGAASSSEVTAVDSLWESRSGVTEATSLIMLLKIKAATLN